MRTPLALLGFLFLGLCPALAADDPVRKVVYPGRTFPNETVPVLDKGYLIFLDRPARISVYGPDGNRLFDTMLQSPENGRLSVMSTAISADGVVAVSAGYSSPQGPGGAIVFLDSTGKQTRFVATGRYMPAHICFDQNQSLWTFGWQRDQQDNQREDREDYFLARRYSKDGKVLGSFLRRSRFSKKLSPFATSLGGWRVRAAEQSIGALAYASSDPEWIELDLDGNLMGRWPLNRPHNGGIAYTTDGRVFAKTWDQKSKQPRLFVLDRTTRVWEAVDDATVHAGGDRSLLLGADQNDLVFADQGGIRLLWVRPVAP